ncbi:MAG: hypothetical protein J6S92_14385 [Oscillospiraceae bacterium]|nr:hypothetical protein [Oscillospiraceae bacterium]MBQ5338834.1 hypothetical protein [Oscillospiraceae bacterium]MBQ9907003.1 hypothetical protein [Oscillospiraceae bacterium]
MSKRKKQMPNSRAKQTQNNPARPAPNNGRNRQEKREAARRPQQTKKSNKPLWLRIVIIAALIAMVLGFVIAPLIH